MPRKKHPFGAHLTLPLATLLPAGQGPTAPGSRSRIGIAQIFGGEEFAELRISVETTPNNIYLIAEIIASKHQILNNTNQGKKEA